MTESMMGQNQSYSLVGRNMGRYSGVYLGFSYDVPWFAIEQYYYHSQLATPQMVRTRYFCFSVLMRWYTNLTRRDFGEYDINHWITTCHYHNSVLLQLLASYPGSWGLESLGTSILRGYSYYKVNVRLAEKHQYGLPALKSTRMSLFWGDEVL